MPDIDIDFADREKAIELFDCVVASRNEKGTLVKHNTGLYFHKVPVDPNNNLCEVAYEEAENLGYFKIDFLNVGLYKDIKNEQHLDDLMNREPLWDLLEQREFVDMLFHINGHEKILQTMKPKSISQLAAILAMIRPAKRYLIGKNWDDVLKEVWVKPENGEYYFKKSHATAYAVAIVVQMNLICEKISYEYS
jgi:DNA polymerase III alpha subunit